MLVFRNPGVADLAALTTLGVSVKAEGSFGWFGTGFKFALATVLRGGGEVKIFLDGKGFGFSADEELIRGEPFKRVWLTDFQTEGSSPLGFTDQLGRGWEPWMALRELTCNARDEGGEVLKKDEGWGLYSSDCPSPGETCIAVTWDKLDEAWDRRANLFAEGEPLWASKHVRVLPGPSSHMFYRGVRARKLEKPSLFRYDVLDRLDLTEDRTMANPWSADRIVREALLRDCDEEGVLGAVVTSQKGSDHEGSLAWDADEHITVSRDFINACVSADGAHVALNPTCRSVWKRWQRSTADVTVGRAYSSAIQDDFSDAVAALEELGFEEVTDLQVMLAEELPGDALSMIEKGRIFIVHKLLRMGRREIAVQLATRVVELKCYSMEGAIERLLPMLLDQHHHTKEGQKVAQYGEDPETEEERLAREDRARVEVEVVAPFEAVDDVEIPY